MMKPGLYVDCEGTDVMTVLEVVRRQVYFDWVDVLVLRLDPEGRNYMSWVKESQWRRVDL